MRFIAICIFIFITILHAEAQRVYEDCDSTTYSWKPDSTIVLGRSQLYIQTGAGIVPRYQFPLPDSDFFVRDFDMVSNSLWYAVVGDRYISDTTTLFKSTDQGLSWQVDTSFYAVSRVGPINEQYNSINQVYALSADTILLFIGYYRSGIIYSTDGGQTWNEWFNNQISHYHGIFECDSTYYIYGQEGDGFLPSMVSFPKASLFSPAYDHPDCFQGNDPDCIYGPPSLNRCLIYPFFKSYVDSICPNFVSIVSIVESTQQMLVTPNPVENTLSVKWQNDQVGLGQIKLLSITGQVIFKQQITLTSGMNYFNKPVEELPSGIYLLILSDPESSMHRLIVKR